MPNEAVIKLGDLNKDQISILRQVCSQVTTTLNAVQPDLGEPLLGMFVALKDQYNGILAKLPMTDAVPAAQEAHWNLSSFLSCLTSTQALLSYLTTRVADMKKATGLNSELTPEAMAAKIAEGINAKVTAGELVPRETVTSLCSAAKDAGAKEARDQAQAAAEAATAKANLIASRKQLLATNSLPLPATEEALLGTDDEFTATVARVTKQAKELVGHGVALNSQAMANAWATEDQFKTFTEILGSVTKSTPKADEAFAGGTGLGAGAKKHRVIV